MEWLLFILAYGLVGTIVGRVLFRLRLGVNSRYQVGKQLTEYGRETGPYRAIDTDDMSSAQTYGLWSIFFWPLTAAIYLIQAPTPQEKQTKKEIELQETVAKAEALLKELESR